MNYSRSIKRSAIAKRILISWILIAVVCLITGVIIGLLVKAESESKTNNKVQLEWDSGKEFIPLDVPLHRDIQEFTFLLCEDYGIEYTLVMGLIQQESSFQSSIISQTDDYGLMQINKANHPYIEKTLGITDLIDPYNNIRSGVFILHRLYERYETTDKVLMAYNLGENGAKKLWEQDVFESEFSKKVLKYQQQFDSELGRNDGIS